MIKEVIIGSKVMKKNTKIMFHMDVFQSVEHVIDITSLQQLIVCFITTLPSSTKKIKNCNSFFIIIL